jgi:hypothetical protein
VSHRVTELHCIMPIENIPSVIRHGILSHEQASRLSHNDISLSDVQDRRKKEKIGNLMLHQYANLYFCARNPMLYLRSNQKDSLCILRVSKEILKCEGIVISDRNASAYDYVKFYESPNGLHHIDFDLVFAEYWTDTNMFEYWRKKSIKCAEVLVPHCVEAGYIKGAYVANETAKVNLENKGFSKPITINAHMFFM